MRDYGKLYTKFFLDRDVRRLPIDAAYLLLYLILGPQTTALGAFRCPTGFIRDDLNWDENRVEQALQSLIKKNFVKFDRKYGWIFVRTFLKWNESDSTNAVIHIGRLFVQVPREVQFYKDMLVSIRDNVKWERFKDGERTAFERRLNALRTHTRAHTEAYSETEAEKYPEARGRARAGFGPAQPAPGKNGDPPPLPETIPLPPEVIEDLVGRLGEESREALAGIRYSGPDMHRSLIYETDQAANILRTNRVTILAALNGYTRKTETQRMEEEQ